MGDRPLKLCRHCEETQSEIERLRFDLVQVQDQLQRVRHLLAGYEDEYVARPGGGLARHDYGPEYLLHRIIAILNEGM